MSVAVLKLENETLVAFNLDLISRMILDKDGLWFDIEGISYSTYEGSSRRLKLHPSVKCKKGESKPFSAEAMFNLFSNL